MTESIVCFYLTFVQFTFSWFEEFHWLHLFVSSSLCLFTCIVKFPACEGKNIHLVGFLPLWFSNVSSKDLPKRVYGHTDRICLTFLHSVFLKESLYRLGERMHSHNGYINLIFLCCVFLDGSSKGLPWKIHCHMGCICFGFLLCALSNVSSNRLP